MESVGAMSESEWSSFSAMYSNEESEFMVQLLNNCSTPNDFHDGSSFRVPSFWPDHESMNMAGVDIGSINSLDNTNINVNRLSLGSTGYNEGSSFFFPTSSYDSYYTSDSNQILWKNNDSMLDYCIGEAKVTNFPGQVCTNNLLEGDDFLNQDMSNDIMEESGGNLPKADILEKSLQLGSEALLPEPEPSKEVELKNPKQKSKKRCCNSGDVSILRFNTLF